MDPDAPLFQYLRNCMPTDGGVSIALYGASRSGKSCLLSDLCKVVFDDDYASGKSYRKPINLIMTTSEHAEPLQDLPKDTLVFGEGYDRRFLKWARQQNKKYKNRYRFSLLFDDVVNTRHKNDLTQLILTDRNKGINSCMSTQYVKLLPPDIRTNLNRVFLLKFFQAEGMMQAVDLYLKAVLPREWHRGRGKEIAYDFYNWWSAPGKGQGFLVNYLDNEGLAITSDRRIFKIEKVIEQFKQGKSLETTIRNLENGAKESCKDYGERASAGQKRERSPTTSPTQARKKPRVGNPEE